MLDLEAIGKRLSELDADAQEVLAEDRRRDHRLFWQGLDVTGKNLERLATLVGGAELESRIRKLEQANGDSTPT
jgi:hypothetical protein